MEKFIRALNGGMGVPASDPHTDYPVFVPVMPVFKFGKKYNEMERLPRNGLAKDQDSSDQRSKMVPPEHREKTVVTPPSMVKVQPERLKQDLQGLEYQWDSERSLTIRLPNTVLFDEGGAEIRPEALPVLNKVAEMAIKTPGYELLVVGHTDDLPIQTTRFPSNWELSAARASAVVKYLAQKGGLDPSRLAASGYGSSWPVVLNDSQEHRAMNRRVEIKLIEKR
jgi:chemotaxis protein MotB